jgi:hypothetical protein
MQFEYFLKWLHEHKWSYEEIYQLKIVDILRILIIECERHQSNAFWNGGRNMNPCFQLFIILTNIGDCWFLNWKF